MTSGWTIRYLGAWLDSRGVSERNIFYRKSLRVDVVTWTLSDLSGETPAHGRRNLRRAIVATCVYQEQKPTQTVWGRGI